MQADVPNYLLRRCRQADRYRRFGRKEVEAPRGGRRRSARGGAHAHRERRPPGHTPIERALSFQTQIEAKILATQEALSEAMGLSPGQVTKMVKAATLVKQGAIGALFVDKSAVPIEQAYKLATLLERSGAKEVILQTEKNLPRDTEGKRAPSEVLRVLIASLDRSKKFAPVRKQYKVGAAGRVIVTRNTRGKVTLAFAQGLQGVEKSAVIKAVEEILEDMG